MVSAKPPRSSILRGDQDFSGRRSDSSFPRGGHSEPRTPEASPAKSVEGKNVPGMRGQVRMIDIIKTRGFQSQEDRPANFTESGFWYESMCVWHSGIGGVRSSVCF